MKAERGDAERGGGRLERGDDGGKGLTRCLVIASELDNAFCSGADLKERRGMSREE